MLCYWLFKGGWTRLTYLNWGLIKYAHLIIHLSLSMAFTMEAIVVNFTIVPLVAGFMEGRFYHWCMQPGGHPFKLLSLSTILGKKSTVNLNANQFSPWNSTMVSLVKPPLQADYYYYCKAVSVVNTIRSVHAIYSWNDAHKSSWSIIHKLINYNSMIKLPTGCLQKPIYQPI